MKWQWDQLQWGWWCTPIGLKIDQIIHEHSVFIGRSVLRFDFDMRLVLFGRKTELVLSRFEWDSLGSLKFTFWKHMYMIRSEIPSICIWYEGFLTYIYEPNVSFFLAFNLILKNSKLHEPWVWRPGIIEICISVVEETADLISGNRIKVFSSGWNQHFLAINLVLRSRNFQCPYVYPLLLLYAAIA